MSVVYLDIVDYLAIAAEVTGLDIDTVSRVAQLNLADSALHAPAASWANEEFYPDFVDKAAVLIVRLAKNHPLPDGNKRAAWVALTVSYRVEPMVVVHLPVGRRSRASCRRHRVGRMGRGAVASWLRSRLQGPPDPVE